MQHTWKQLLTTSNSYTQLHKPTTNYQTNYNNNTTEYNVLSYKEQYEVCWVTKSSHKTIFLINKAWQESAKKAWRGDAQALWPQFHSKEHGCMCCGLKAVPLRCAVRCRYGGSSGGVVVHCEPCTAPRPRPRKPTIIRKRTKTFGRFGGGYWGYFGRF